MTRHSSFAGSFYPNDPNAIKSIFTGFKKSQSSISSEKIKAVIVPHAGYIYSGYTANSVYANLDVANYSRIAIIGPSHRIYFKGTSISLHTKFDTPFGELGIDTSYAKYLLSKFDLGFAQEVHAEHSTEVQVPFIMHYLPSLPIIEMIYSNEESSRLVPVIEQLISSDTLVVISTDLSHFKNLKEANRLDSICLDAITDLDVNKLHSGCEACGFIGVEAMIQAAKNLNLKASISDYSTSADETHDESSVVGYAGAFIYED